MRHSTEEELNRCRQIHGKSNKWGWDLTFENMLTSQLYGSTPAFVGALLVAPIPVALTLGVYAFIDSCCRRGLTSHTMKPGLVGTVRECYQIYKKDKK